MPPFLFAFPVVNIANLAQSNTQWGANVAVGSPLAVQTLAQIASNSATVTQR